VQQCTYGGVCCRRLICVRFQTACGDVEKEARPRRRGRASCTSRTASLGGAVFRSTLARRRLLSMAAGTVPTQPRGSPASNRGYREPRVLDQGLTPDCERDASRHSTTGPKEKRANVSDSEVVSDSMSCDGQACIAG